MRASVAALICMCLTACGGGGSAPTPVQVANRAPVLADPGALTLLEGASSVATISASDADNNSLTVHDILWRRSSIVFHYILWCSIFCGSTRL